MSEAVDLVALTYENGHGYAGVVAQSGELRLILVYKGWEDAPFIYRVQHLTPARSYGGAWKAVTNSGRRSFAAIVAAFSYLPPVRGWASSVPDDAGQALPDFRRAVLAAVEKGLI